MSEENKNDNRIDQDVKRGKRRKKKKKRGFFKKFLLIFLVICLILGAIAAGMVFSILRDVPKIDPTNINSSLDQTSTILSPDGQVIEKIQAPENRTVVKLEKMPKHLRDAFISIEDERFESHMGIDPRGIAASAVDNVKAGRIVRGASTITQQLVKNVYLTREKSWERKIKEAYLSLKVERVLSKDQILELYLNRIFLGQNAYGVQEAAQAYFSKNVEDLTIAESALIAGIAQSSVNFSPYKTIRSEDFDPEKHDTIATLDLMGEKYIAIFNPNSIERQKVVLQQMLKLNKITKAEYDEALQEDIRANLKPATKELTGLSSYFTDYVKNQVVEVLMTRLDYTEEDARNELSSGGLKIYSTIDLKLQKELEDIYDNFTNVLIGNTSGVKGPVLVNWKRNGSGDIIDNNGNIVYYQRNNILNDNDDLMLSSSEFSFDNGGLKLKSPKLRPYRNNIDITDYYGIDDNKNLVTYNIGAISLPEGDFFVNENKEIIITNDFLDKTPDFYTKQGNSLLINGKYFSVATTGIVQPQSATVILDYKNGHIKALVGGRNIKGAKVLNRATASQRQPGSVMKPIGTYLPALDNGFTAASAIDDIPFYAGGKMWPRNWYRDQFRGLMPLRTAVEQSANVPAVKVLDKMGVQTSLPYLEKMGIIKNSDPEHDSFVTSKEDPSYNDENLSALALGGMTRGLTPLEITAAFGTIANDGTYIEPMSFSKIEDKNGNILIDNTKMETKVVSPQTAYIMKDILNTTVTRGIARRAQIPNMATAGKTGTTTNQADIWFVGFSPHYATGVWIGNDSPAITISKGSGSAAQLWKHIMTKAHEGMPAKPKFDRPDGIVSVSVCRDSGLLPTSACSGDPRGGRVYTEIFAKGTEPKKSCDVHVSARIDSATGKLATDSCAEANIVNKVFIKRTPPYDPSKHGGITPPDYAYTLPTAQCTDHSGVAKPEDDNEAVEVELDGENSTGEGVMPDGTGGTETKPTDTNKVKEKVKDKIKETKPTETKPNAGDGVDFTFD